MKSMELDLRAIGVIVTLGAIALVSTGRLYWDRTSRRWRLARLRKRARRGERDAEALLGRLGYRIVDRQAGATLVYEVDGEPREASVRADLLVTRRGRRYVAEVKTGREAPRPTNVATRRQLLEYAHAFDVDGLLLVDAERGEVHEVLVPQRGPIPSRWPWLIVGALLGAAGVWVLTSSS